MLDSNITYFAFDSNSPDYSEGFKAYKCAGEVYCIKCSDLSSPQTSPKPKELIHLFTPIDKEKEMKYQALNRDLLNLLNSLEESMESVNLEDHTPIIPHEISLKMPASSSLQRRRAKSAHS
ncbi:unnamed protein product [Blepharisma stoltei]|uniref:Uncharacterized protein n=1 Tax=Blepharisma stoltei TaxID=1481888 RepID=A0AAU9J118_9CILI|nr:unnamed protein product [Blepharisma stoltei]